MKIIHRYVLREHLGPLTFSLSALTFLLLINYVAKHFGELVGKGLPAWIIAQFFLLSVPFTVAMTFPMSVLVATLYAFSRLAAENEITALKANGVSMVRLLVPVLITASFFAVGMIWFNDRVLPHANHQLRTLQSDIARKKPTFTLRPQIMNEVVPAKFFLRTNHLDPYSGHMREVTIYDMADPQRRRTIYADSGDMAFAPNGDDLLLTLHRGYMLEVPKQEPLELHRLHFATDYIKVEGVANQLDITANDTYKSDREMSICELQNEVSRNEHELDQAQASLRASLQAAVTEALTGVPAAPTMPAATTGPSFPGTPAPRSEHFSLGRLFCDARHRLQRVKWPHFAVRTASAAEPLGQGSTAGATVQGATARAAVDTTRRDTTRATGDSARPLHIPLPLPLPLPVAVQDTPGGRGAPGLQRDTTVRPPVDSLPQPRMAGVVPGAAALGGSAYLMGAAIENARMRAIDGARGANMYAVELHKKFAISVACLVFVLIGAPIALRFPRGGVGLVIGVSLVVFAIYYVGLIAGEALSDKDLLTPFWAMWSANLLLSATGIALLLRMGRESATSRGGDVHELMDLLRGIFSGRARARER